MISPLPYIRRGSLPPVPAASAAPSTAADLQTQLEALLDAVWKAEADWRFNDRIDLALRERR
jgi:hypothetical protein